MRLVLFDVDGTLVDARGAGRWSLERAFERVFNLGRDEGFSARIRFDGATDPSIIEEIASAAGVESVHLDRARADLEEAYLEILERRLSEGEAARPLPGVVRLLTSLQGSGEALGLVTGNIRSGARLKIASAGLSEFFQEGAYGSDGTDRAVLARLARERLERRTGRAFEPGEVVLLGDSQEDVRAARVNGYRSLAVATGVARAEDLVSAGADNVLRDLSGTESVLEWIERGA